MARARDAALSCTHDANAWPADRYAGLPAPAPGERVVLWVQNSHPTPIPAGAIGLNPMGEERGRRACREPLGPFASRAVDVAELLPGLAWPRQIEVRAGKHVVRPRYEIVGRRAPPHRACQCRARRSAARPGSAASSAPMLGKGYLLPAPILPRGEWESLLLPTPMAHVAERVADRRAGLRRRWRANRAAAARPPAARSRDGAVARRGRAGLGDGYGHVELVYDFRDGGSGDGWLHALFRYRHRGSGHAAETSFGAHVFNTILTYRDEPQSYVGRPPGLSTRLFLRLGDERYDTLCQLIYPASLPWRAAKRHRDHSARPRRRRDRPPRLAIPCSGSRLFRYHALFDEETRARAGAGAYAIIRDPTCRLFGYHGLLGQGGAFSLDHMFGF